MTESLEKYIDDFNRIVRETCDKHPSDGIDYVVNKICRMVKGQEGLYEQLHRADWFFRATVRESVHGRRHKIIDGVKNGNTVASRAARNPAAFDGTAETTAAGILDTYLMPNGGVLGDMTREELDVLAHEESKRAEGHMLNATFFGLLAPRTEPGSKVRDCVDGKTAAELLAKAKGLATRCRPATD